MSNTKRVRKPLTPEQKENARETRRRWVAANPEENERRAHAHYRKYYLANREKLIQANKKWAEEHPEKVRASARRRRLANPGYGKDYYAKNRQVLLDAILQSSYNITRAQYNERVQAQGGVCELCKSPGTKGRRETKLYVDHIMVDNTPVIRGLLCHKCNCALGMLGDNEVGLTRALEYVRGYRSV